jgi:hypothetical protein
MHRIRNDLVFINNGYRMILDIDIISIKNTLLKIR